MAHALALGQRGLGQVAPWPSVGCVLVRHGRVVGRGTSDPETVRHAERVALDQAGPAAHGATAYVTLEPCSHHGRTPPCADALVEAGIARVVIAIGDPNPLVGGQGIARLQAAGIQVDVGLGAKEATEQHRGFLSVVTQGRPTVTLKLATTLDGRIATATGESRWITGAEARRTVHAMRMRHDAVLVGAGTARADDPSLTVRDMGARRQPMRVVFSRNADLPTAGTLVRTARDTPVIVCHGPDLSDERRVALEDAGVQLVDCALSGRQLDVADAVLKLGGIGLTGVFCEGGGALAASLLGAGLVDELVVMTAGLTLGAEGQPAVGALGVSALDEAERFELVETRAIGADVLHRWVR